MTGQRPARKQDPHTIDHPGTDTGPAQMGLITLLEVVLGPDDHDHPIKPEDRVSIAMALRQILRARQAYVQG